MKRKNISFRDQQRFVNAINKWKMYSLETKDKELAAAYKKDAEDLKSIYDAIIDDRYDIAQRLINKLDTIVRDQIPLSVYNIVFNSDED